MTGSGCQQIFEQEDKLIIGPDANNECCVCCGMTKCFEGRNTDVGVGCPSHCCPCPPTGDIMASFASSDCAPLDGLEVTFTRGLGITICSGENPDNNTILCYPSTYEDGLCDFETPPGPNPLPGCDPYPEVFQKTLKNWPYEKWGFSGVICEDGLGPDCSGQQVRMSLCCCDLYTASDLGPGATGDCHSCRYQFHMDFIPWDPADNESYCSCPTGGGYMGANEFALPQCTDPINYPCNPTQIVWPLTGSDCDTSGKGAAWTVSYKLDDVWWNCDCCAGGVDPGDEVDVTVTFTPA